MNELQEINIFWFRRDLRLNDNTGLNAALSSSLPVVPLFIFDTDIIDELPHDDPRISFIYSTLNKINDQLRTENTSLLILKGKPLSVWKELASKYRIKEVYFNKDYEPYSKKRDSQAESFLNSRGIKIKAFKDQVIFEESEILKNDGSPYTVFTPYKNRWIEKFRLGKEASAINTRTGKPNWFQHSFPFPSLSDLGFSESSVRVKPYDLSVIPNYHNTRDYPASEGTTGLSPFLRFGCVSIREMCSIGAASNEVFLSELIWREFFMQILWHFPQVVTRSFKEKYDNIQWNPPDENFRRWCMGETGYPVVDAGMRQLNRTGCMHNRVRMITASFLCKHLLIDWRLGEAYFAEKLIDYELSSNNGNWQWAAGSGCDAAPYFRVFNPEIQQKKFDPGENYINQWVENIYTPYYPEKIIEHDFARRRAIDTYRRSLGS